MIENRTCTYLGIYVRQIEDAGDTVGDVCEKHGIDEDDVWEFVNNDFYERFSIPDNSHFGNAVTYIIFDCLKDALVQSGIERDRINFYINGSLDTHFYIDNEEVF